MALAASLALLLPGPVLADGGAGGNGAGGSGGTVGGTDSATDTGTVGGSPPSGPTGNPVGAGGAGAGAVGGAGGNANHAFGGAGGATPGASGAAGKNTSAANDGGGGGGGGAHGAVVTSTTNNSGTITAGNGGQGGSGLFPATPTAAKSAGAGGGGAGGWGVVVNGTSLTYTNTSTGRITGGAGGMGGDTLGIGNNGGGAGSGGIGIAFTNAGTLNNQGTISGGNGANGGNTSGTGTVSGAGGNAGGGVVFFTGGDTLNNSGTIQGGGGGPGGTGGATSGTNGAGGIGVSGSDLTIVNSGSIVPGSNGDGNSVADAIVFTGGTNSLTITSTSRIFGKVIAFSAADTLEFGGGTNGTFSLTSLGASGSGAPYQGFGLFQMNGGGTWTLTGTTALTGPWTVNSGTLQVGTDALPSASLAGPVTITDGTLSGLGTVGDITNNAGTLSPGTPTSPYGTLHGTGIFNQGTEGTLTINVSPTQNSSLVVGGAATLAGLIKFNFAAGTYTNATYTFLTANSVTGTFTTNSGTNPTGLTQTLMYTGTTAELVLSGGAPAPPTPPIPPAPPPTPPTPAALPSTTAPLSPLANYFQNADTLVGLAGGTTAPPGVCITGLYCARNGFEFQGFGGFGALNSSATAPGFVSSTGGFRTAYQGNITNDVAIRLGGQYTHMAIDQGQTSGQLDGGLVYGSIAKNIGADSFIGTAGFGHNWTTSERPVTGVGTASGSYGTEAVIIGGAWQERWQFAGWGGGPALNIVPTAGIDFAAIYQHAYGETGAGASDLTVNSLSGNSLQPFIGVYGFQDYKIDDEWAIGPTGQLRYSHQVLNVPSTLMATDGTGANFRFDYAVPSRDQLTTGIGVTVLHGPNLSFYAKYDAALPTGNNFSQYFGLGLQWLFAAPTMPPGTTRTGMGEPASFGSLPRTVAAVEPRDTPVATPAIQLAALPGVASDGSAPPSRLAAVAAATPPVAAPNDSAQHFTIRFDDRLAALSPSGIRELEAAAAALRGGAKVEVEIDGCDATADFSDGSTCARREMSVAHLLAARGAMPPAATYRRSAATDVSSAAERVENAGPGVRF